MTAESARVAVRRVDGDGVTDAADQVVIEEPLEIRIAGQSDEPQSLAITMRTPGADSDLVAGFLLSEGIIESWSDVSGLREVEANVVDVQLAAGRRVDFAKLQRHFYATSSCGVCGKASLEALAVRPRVKLSDDCTQFDATDLAKWPARLGDRQAVFAATGGLHAAALFNADGELLCLREDIGRHNAVDKLIGAALAEGRVPLRASAILVSGRAGFEVVQKALMAGCPLLASVGAPSSLAVELAWEFDMSLVGFLRDGRFNIYAGPARIA